MHRLRSSSLLFVVFNICCSAQCFALGSLIEDETFKAHFPTAWASSDEISPLCYNDSLSYLQAYWNKEKWASESIINTPMILAYNGITIDNIIVLCSVQSDRVDDH